MKTSIVITLFAVAVLGASTSVGCGKGKKSDSGASAFEGKTDQVTDIKVGDSAVVESGKANFWKGKVVKVEGTKVTYEYGSNKSTDTADKTDVYVIKVEHVGAEKAGDYVICRTGTDSWEPCVVKSVNAGVYACEDDDGDAHNLSASDVILPKPATQANIKDKIEAEAKDRAFHAAAKAAGKPYAPPGWKPRAGAEVVALFAGTHWWGAKVTKVAGQKTTVAWDDKSSPSERDSSDVAPKPNGPQKVTAGQFVLGRPSGSSTIWEFHRVDSVAGSTITMSDEHGKQRTVTDKDVVPIVP